MKKDIKTIKDIGSIVRSKRKEIGLTQKQVSDMCNVGVRFLSELENGKMTLEIGKVLTILNALGLEVKIEARGFESCKR
ncbi:MAG: helix-turn-helix transcriptional regulator [Candidatus Omnitrophica bacterium]|nr:helix-turn-helix transcriptional regulator [Candidatus Omnitrophota bacterium]